MPRRLFGLSRASGVQLLAIFLLGCSGGSGGPGGSGGSGAGGGAGSSTTTVCQSLNCADQGLLCNAASGTCVRCLSDQDCLSGMFSTGNPNAVCLPGGTCGCTADPQCAGQREGIRCVQSLQQCGCESNADCSDPGALTCAANHRCGCSSNQDCAGKVGGGGPIPVCDPPTGDCVACVTDADCTDPNNRVCDPTLRICLPCRTSTDCAQNANGPVCQDLGQLQPGIGECGCTTDQDCVGRAGGPSCVSNGSPYKKCGCATASDCTGSANGHACINPYRDDWMQCGCGTVVAADCPSGKSCVGYTCQ